MPAAVSSRAMVRVSVPLRQSTATRPGVQKEGAMEPSSPSPGTQRPSVFGPTIQDPAARAARAASSVSCTGTYSAATTMLGMPAAARTASSTPSGGV